jgi:hypothetical protein
MNANDILDFAYGTDCFASLSYELNGKYSGGLSAKFFAKASGSIQIYWPTTLKLGKESSGYTFG